MEKHTCKTCQNVFTGNYCNQCGEKVISKNDLTLKKILADLFSALTFADTKLWRTLRVIVFKPGVLSRKYMDGIRVGYMKPVSIFFLANLLYFIAPIFNTYNTPLHIQTSAFNGLYSETATQMVEQKLEKDTLSKSEYESRYAAFEVRYNTKTTELSKLLLIVVVLFGGLWLWLLHARGNHRIVGHFIVSFEITTFLILICLQLLGIIAWTVNNIFSFRYNEDLIISLTILSVLFPFIWLIERNFYASNKLKSLLNAILMNVGLVAGLFAYRAFLFFVTFWSL